LQIVVKTETNILKNGSQIKQGKQRKERETAGLKCMQILEEMHYHMGAKGIIF
jgi:hypothetical protein